MPRTIRLSRRAFLTDLGRGTVAITVFGAVAIACGGDDDGTAAPAEDPTAPPLAPGNSTAGDAGPLEWRRVALGGVSAYVLLRDGRAAIVDTGGAGSEDEIAGALSEAGAGYDAVDHVVLTHLHPDHVGSVPGVLDAAPSATAYAGAADLDAIASPRPIRPVGDGDEVFGLEIIATPGHTAGHVSVFDAGSGLLVAGDALTAADGRLNGPNPSFTADLDTAQASVARMAELDVSTVLVGHGDPVEQDAERQLDDLAATS